MYPLLPRVQESYTTNPVAGASGERESPYKGGMFKIEIRLPGNYPQDPPDVKFATRIWHPQVDRETGKPCVDFLREQWKPTLGLRDVLVMLRQLLGSPSACERGHDEGDLGPAALEA